MISRPQDFDKVRALFWPMLLLLGNLLVAVGTELAYDEAYYWLFSRHLAWGYFDHPPMAALWIALSSWIPGELGVRLTFILATQAAAYLLSSMVPKEKRWLVWASFSLFPLLAFSGFLALPDGPLVVFSAVWLWCLNRGLKRDTWANAAIMGLVSACLLYSKYHGVLFMVGTIIALPRLLKSATFWFAAILGLALFLPHVHWQWAHDFATLRYHFIERPKVPIGFESPLEMLGSQLILQGALLGPWLWYCLFKTKPQTEFDRALKVICIFIPLFFLFSSLNKKVEANWAVAAGLPMIVLLAREGELRLGTKWVRGLGIAGLLIVFAGRLLMIMPPQWHFLKRGAEFHGWKKWADEVQAKAGPGCTLVANRYQIASKLSFYLHSDITALNVGSRLNQFEFWDWDKALLERPVCWVTQVQHLYPGDPVPTPDGKNLILVKGISLGDILSHKDKSL